MSIGKALKKLYLKIVGTNTKGVSAGKILSDLADNFPDISGNLPSVTSADNGKALLVINGAWGKGVIAVLPAVTSADDGKILKVEKGAWTLGDETSELPVPTSEDIGKTVVVNSDGTGYELK